MLVAYVWQCTRSMGSGPGEEGGKLIFTAPAAAVAVVLLNSFTLSLRRPNNWLYALRR